MVRRFLPLLAGLLLVVPGAPARAAPEGCVAVGSHTIQVMGQRPYDCFFTATGPSYYVAATTNPYVIAVLQQNGTWKELVRRAESGPPESGILGTVAGNYVSVSISCWNYAEEGFCHPGDIGGRYGVVAAHSQP